MYQLVNGDAIPEEVINGHWVDGEHVVVAVYEMLGKLRDSAQEHLYRGAVERGQKPFWNYVLVENHMHFALVKPFRNLLYV